MVIKPNGSLRLLVAECRVTSSPRDLREREREGEREREREREREASA